MMNKIHNTILKNSGNILNVYFTAGYPELQDTVSIIKALDHAGADIIELGMPYSDPLADGITIQQSSAQALKNGITLDTIFQQVSEARKHTDIPIVLMGYYNQLLQYGVERFLEKASAIKIDGLIIPDLPMDIYEHKYLSLFKKYGIGISFLIGPHTSSDRMAQADRLSSGFIYVISQSSITGKKGELSTEQIEHFQNIKNQNLNNPTLIGFGIHDHKSYAQACEYADGAIIGSAYIRALADKNSDEIEDITRNFVQKIKKG